MVIQRILIIWRRWGITKYVVAYLSDESLYDECRTDKANWLVESSDDLFVKSLMRPRSFGNS